MDDYLNRFEVLLRRGVFALEKIAAAVAPPKDEHRDVKPAEAPSHATKGREDAPHAPPLDELPEVQRAIAETARAMAKALSQSDLVDWDLVKAEVGKKAGLDWAKSDSNDEPEECGHGNASHSCGLCTGADRAHVDRHGRLKLGDATVVRNDGVALGPQAVANLLGPSATAAPEPRPAGVFLRPGARVVAPVTPASWDEPKVAATESAEERCTRLRRHLYALVAQKHGRLDSNASSVKARAACGVESVAKATDAQLEAGIKALSALPDFVEPVAPAPPAAPVEPYTVAAGIARGLSPKLAASLAEGTGDEPVSLAELTQVHSRADLAAAKKKAGFPAGWKARQKAEARRVVMRLPFKAAPPAPSPKALTRAEALARKLGASPHAAAVGAELAAAEASRTKGSAASDLCVSVCDLLKARLSPSAWESLSWRHSELWDGPHPTLGGVLALVDDAPDEVTT